MLNDNEIRGLPKDIDMLISAGRLVTKGNMKETCTERRLQHLERCTDRVSEQYEQLLSTPLKVYEIHYCLDNEDDKDIKHDYKPHTHDFVLVNFHVIAYSEEQAISLLVKSYPEHKGISFEIEEYDMKVGVLQKVRLKN